MRNPAHLLGLPVLRCRLSNAQLPAPMDACTSRCISRYFVLQAVAGRILQRKHWCSLTCSVGAALRRRVKPPGLACSISHAALHW